MIILTKNVHDILLRWASKYPSIEVCGMVWQHNNGTHQTAWPLRNIHSQPDRYYAIYHKELQGAYERMDAADATLLAFYHSHPGGKPDPSEADMEGALNVGIHYLILYPEVVASEPALPAKSLWRVSAWDCIEMGILLQDEVQVQ